MKLTNALCKAKIEIEIDLALILRKIEAINLEPSTTARFDLRGGRNWFRTFYRKHDLKTKFCFN